jgi:hypothetical protein
VVAATVATADTSLTVADATAFKIGDIIEFSDGERAWISAVDLAGDAVTVELGFQGTTPATHATGTVNIIGHARLEGAENDYGPLQTKTTNFNYTQIFQESVKVTGSKQELAQYGMPGGELDYQVEKKVKEQWKAVERTFFNGIATAGNGASSPRTLGGMKHFISTLNTLTVAATAFILGNLENLIISCHAATDEVPSSIWMNPARLKTLKDLYDNSAYLRVDPSVERLGMAAHSMVTPWAPSPVPFMTSHHISTADIFLVNDEYTGGYTYRDWMEWDIPKGGDYIGREMVAEFSFVMAKATAHARVVLT